MQIVFPNRDFEPSSFTLVAERSRPAASDEDVRLVEQLYKDPHDDETYFVLKRWLKAVFDPNGREMIELPVNVVVYPLHPDDMTEWTRRATRGPECEARTGDALL